MKKLIATTALIATVAAPAFAGAGKDQLAALAGVNGDNYTIAELVRLDAAQAGNDYGTVNLITANANGDTLSTQSGVSNGEAQLAALAGVEPGVYSVSQLVRLSQAQTDNDYGTIRLIESQANGETFSTQSGVSAGDAQLAALVGVTPGSLTTAQMIRLDNALSDGDDTTANYILSQAR